jgi:S1-C subfamily serine protease/peroxiredoxin
MSLRVTCPGCQTVLKVDDKYAGRVLVCRQCQRRFRVAGTAGTSGSRPAPSELQPDTDEPLFQSPPALRRQTAGRGAPPKRSAGPHWGLIAAGGAGGTLLLCALCWFLFLRPTPTAPTPAANAPAVSSPEVANQNPAAADAGRVVDAAAKPSVAAGAALENPAASKTAPVAKLPTGTPSLLPSAPLDGHASGTAAAPVSPAAIATIPPQRPDQHPADGGKSADKTDLAALPLEELIARVGDGVVLIKVLDQAGKPLGLGSGFVIDDKGSIATCFHVVRHAKRAQVEFRDGFTTEVSGSLQLSPQADLAILQLKEKPKQLTVLRLAGDAKLRVGQDVIAIGHPSGLTFTPTRGIINGLHKTSELPADARQFLSLRNASKDEEWVQTDAVISPGNSGGPLMNRRGEVVGINSWVSTQTRFAFAVHVKHLEELEHSLFAKAKPLSAASEMAGGGDENAPIELEPKVDALFHEYQRATENFLVELDQLRATAHTRADVDALFKRNPSNQFATRFVTLGKQNPKTKTAFQSFLMACFLLRGADPKQSAGTLQQATDLLLQDHLQDRDIGKVALLMPALTQSGTKSFLRSLLQQGPTLEARAYACLALVKTLQRESDTRPDSAAIPATDKEIVALLKRLTGEFANVTLQGHRLAELAQPLLVAKERVGVGKKAPEIEAADGTGSDFKLSDFRGKVVLLEFWGDWSPQCVRLYPYERILVNKYKGRKFVMLGVNTDAPDRFEAVQKEKKVTWRSWADGAMGGPIAKEWGVDTVPTMYLIDHKGTIRMRGTFDPDTVELALDRLLAEAEGRAKPGRRTSPSGRRR